MSTKTYDPNNVKITFTFKGIEFRGFADGGFIEVGERTDQEWCNTAGRMVNKREHRASAARHAAARRKALNKRARELAEEFATYATYESPNDLIRAEPSLMRSWDRASEVKR